MTRRSTDRQRYQRLQDSNKLAWEKLCGHCGACCGAADGDPCEHLATGADGRYSCDIYQNRFGVHKTISGKELKCVPIREILHKPWPGDECCGYKLMMSKMKGGKL